MFALFTENEVAEAAVRYFDAVKSDLLTHGGVANGREQPLLRSHAFACAVYDELAVILAREYHDGLLDYSSADDLANWFQHLLTRLGTWPKDGSGTGPDK
jgi:hypothetical protein